MWSVLRRFSLNKILSCKQLAPQLLVFASRTLAETSCSQLGEGSSNGPMSFRGPPASSQTCSQGWCNGLPLLTVASWGLPLGFTTSL